MAEREKTAVAPEPDLDSLLEPLGGFGKFQILNILAISSLVFICAFSELGYVFTAGDVNHRCLISECESSDSGWDDSGKPWLSASIPKTSSGAYDSCRRYNNTLSQCTNGSFSGDTYKCNSFVYETEEWTIAREDWDLHCDDDRYLLNLVGSLNNAGQVVGGLYVGYLSDRFGRKVVVVTMTLLVSLFGIIKSFSISYVMMVIFEALEASMAVAIFNGSFVLALEIVDPTKRVLAGALVSSAYSVGEMVLGLVQFLTLEWRTTVRILYAPFLLTVIYYWTLPKSVRWLLDSNRPDEAVAVLRRIAKTNRRPLPEQALKQVLTHQLKKKEITEKGQDAGNKILELWRSKRMRLRVAACYFVWLCITFVYFGLSLNSVSVSADKFLNFVLSALVEIPAYIVTYLLLDRIGRRVSQSSSILLCGVACILDGFVPDGDSWSWAKLLLYLIGKFGISSAMFVIDVYTTEMFPTSIRSSMMSTGLLLGKLASILAPQVPLLSDIYEPLPVLIFGAMAVASGLVAITFPETLNCKLPDTMEEAEDLGRKKRKTTQYDVSL